VLHAAIRLFWNNLNPKLSAVKYSTTPPEALQFKRFVFAILVYVFIWVAKLRGIALNFRAWE
jgi:hypothetical protein